MRVPTGQASSPEEAPLIPPPPWWSPAKDSIGPQSSDRAGEHWS